MKKAFNYLLIILPVILTSCVKPFNPPVTTTNYNYLVVDGFINGGTDSTFIKLSRTRIIANSTYTPETGAIVTVEDNQNNSYSLKEIAKGNYATPTIGLVNSRSYRVRVKTTYGLVYLSDFEPVKNSPPIDSIGFNVTSAGISLYTNTHDPLNNTRYYRWEFRETWKFHSLYVSDYIFTGTQIVLRPASNQIYYCFAGDTSTSILLGSSAKLSQDVISQAPILTIPSTSEKIELRYSILLKQYALPKEAYDYWLNLQTNTQNLGSIFDAQPSATSGNIHCITDATIPVIGYIGSGLVAQKRIFIDKSQLPSNWAFTYPYEICPMDSLSLGSIVGVLTKSSELLITHPYFSNSGILLGYVTSYTPCVDCTIRGKVTQPVFWK